MRNAPFMSAVHRKWSALCQSTPVSDLFFGFGVVDGVLLAGMYVLGTYLIVDVPIQLMFFGLGFYAFAESSRGWRCSAALSVIVVLLLIVCVTAVVVPLVPRYGPVSLNLRLLHALAGKYFLLGFLPFMWRHLRREWLVPDQVSRTAARFGWMFLKFSFWAGAFMALLVIKGQLIAWHVSLLLLAAPLVTVHVVVSTRRSRLSHPGNVIELSWLSQRLSWAGFSAAVLVAMLVTVAFAFLVPQQGEGVFNLVAPAEERTASGVPDLRPSQARLLDGHLIRSQFLGQSASCGVSPCHPIKLEQWRTSPHRNSVTPEYRNELEATIKTHGAPFGRLCAGCHDPISLFSGQVDFSQPLISPDSEREGISCLVCHRLTASERTPANGAVDFRFPEYYGRLPAWPFAMVFFWKEHIADFAAADSPDDRVCIACHRFRPLDQAVDSAQVSDWMGRSYHQQSRMIPECHGERGCISCHMPAIGHSEKPAGRRSDHRFGTVQSPRPSSVESGGPAPRSAG